jgi:hypothetical protein
MDRIIIAERSRSVQIIINGLSLRQQLLTLSQSLFRLQYFMISYAVYNMNDFSCLTINDNKYKGVFSIFAEGQGHVPLPRVKVAVFLGDEYKSVMSKSRQTNGAHGCLMSPKKVRYHLKVEQLFARGARRNLVLTYKHQTLRLA